MNKTSIEWTDATWNPIRGCSRVSEGCRNCYAEKVAYRFSGPGQPYEGLVRVNTKGERVPDWNGQVQLVEKHLLDPLKWGPIQWKEYVENDPLGQFSVKARPRRIFVNSMSDLFHESVPDEWIDRIFAVMALCPQHTFQILTKRPERMLAYVTALKSRLSYGPPPVIGRQSDLRAAIKALWPHDDLRQAEAMLAVSGSWEAGATPLPNVWLGVSVENQKAADERIPLLLQTPAAVRFISAEPLLGQVEVSGWLRPSFAVNTRDCKPMQDKTAELLSKMAIAAYKQSGGSLIDWVIVGGESGPGARPMHPDWARSLRDQCQAAGVPFFFKQWGEWAIDHVAPNETDWSDGHALVNSYNGDIRGIESLSDETTVSMYKAGKHAAGALLDGREWREFPEVRP